jgi:hypothetical protein
VATAAELSNVTKANPQMLPNPVSSLGWHVDGSSDAGLMGGDKDVWGDDPVGESDWGVPEPNVEAVGLCILGRAEPAPRSKVR